MTLHILLRIFILISTGSANNMTVVHSEGPGFGQARCATVLLYCPLTYEARSALTKQIVVSNQA
jgi:hypothetical protein